LLSDTATFNSCNDIVTFINFNNTAAFNSCNDTAAFVSFSDITVFFSKLISCLPDVAGKVEEGSLRGKREIIIMMLTWLSELVFNFCSAEILVF
jgi:hypothetical protein